MTSPLAIALALAAAGLLTGLLIALRPVRLSISVQGQADEDRWAVAGGFSLWPLSASGAAAPGIAPRLVVHLLGRKLLTLSLASRAEWSQLPLAAWWRRLERFVDPLELAAFLFAETRRISVESLQLEVKGGLPDPAATATVMGVLATAAGILAPLGSITYEPDWSGVPQGTLRGEVALRASPLLCFLDVLRFSFRNVHLRAPARPEAAPQPS